MGKIIVTEFLALDGVFEDPGGGDGTSFGGWSMSFGDERFQKYKFDELTAAGSQLLGRRTYEGFAKAWPAAQGSGAFGEKMNHMPKFVVSTTLENPEWDNTQVIKGDVAQRIARLKEEQEQDILVAGSGTLVRFLLAHRLADTIRLLVYPVIVGQGKHLFDGSDKTVLKLTHTEAFPGGCVVLEYEPAA